MKIRDIMHSGLTATGPDTPVPQVARKMRDLDIGAVPVVENGKVIGIVTDRDLALRAVADGIDAAALKAREVMSKNVVCCHATDEVESALRSMELAQVRRIPVKGEADELVGMVSLGDIVAAKALDKAQGVMQAVATHHG